MEIIGLPNVDSTAALKVFPAALVKQLGGDIKEIGKGQYFIINGSEEKIIFPHQGKELVIGRGIYRKHFCNEFNIFAYKISDWPHNKEEEVADENIQELQGIVERDNEGPGGDGDTSPSSDVPKQKHRR